MIRSIPNCANTTVLVAALLGSCVGAPPTLEGTEAPTLFAPGVVSTHEREFATTFSPDGRTVYFNRVDDQGRIPILRSRWENGGWSSPERLAFTDETFLDVDPFVTSDGEQLLFTTDRTEQGSEPSADFDIWSAQRDGDGWAQPKRLPSPPNSPASEAFVSATTSGTLYFGSTDTADGSRRVLRSELIDGHYGPTEEIDLGLEEGVSAGNPLILPDESALIFTSRDLAGMGEVDLFISYRDAHGNWSEPQPLPAPINSPFNDFAPGLGPGGRGLFFASGRGGLVEAGEVDETPGDLYFVRFPARDD